MERSRRPIASELPQGSIGTLRWGKGNGMADVSAFDRLCRVTARALAVPFAAIIVLDADGDTLVGRAGLDHLPSRSFPPVDHSLIWHVRAANRTVTVGDTRNLPQFNALHERIGTFAGTPVVANDEVVGVLVVADREPRTWTAADVDMLDELAPTVAALLRQHRNSSVAEAMVASMSDAMFALDASGRILHLNNYAAKLIQSVDMSRTESWIGHELRMLIPATMAAELDESMVWAAKTGLTVRFEVYATSLDTWFSGSIFPARGLFTVQIRDITDRKSVELSLRNETERLTTIVHTQGEVLRSERDVSALLNVIVDRARSITGASGAAIEMLDGEDVVLRAATGVLAEFEGARFPVSAASVRAVLKDGSPVYVEDVEASGVDGFLADVVGARSIVAVPLVDVEASYDALLVIGEQPYMFDARDRRTLELMAGFIAAAIARGREVDTRQRLLDEQAATLNALRASEQRFRDVFAHAPIGQTMVGLDGRIIDVNPAFCQITGYDRSELIGRYIPEITHPDDRAMTDQHRAALVAGELPYYQIEKRYIRKDGSIATVQLTTSPVRDDAGLPHYLIGLVQDITERRHAEARIRDAELRYRSLVEQIPAVVYAAGLDNLVSTLYISPQIGQLLGYEPDEWIGNRDLWLERLHPDDRDWMVRETREAAGRERFSAQYRLIARDGRVVWIRDEAKLIRDAAGAPQFWQGVMVDITAQKEAEEEIRALEAKHRSLIDRANDLIIVVDRSGAVTFANRQFTEVLGYRLEESRGLHLRDFVHPSDLDAVMRTFQERLSGNLAFGKYELRMVTKSGRVIYVESSSSPIFDADGSIVAIQAISRDITDRKAAEQRYKSLYEHNPDVIFFLDRDGICTAINRAAEDLFGYAKEDVIGKPGIHYVLREDRERIREHFAKAIAGLAQCVDVRIVDQEQRLVEAQMTLVPVVVGGSITGVHAIIKDITMQKLLEQQLEHRAFYDYLTGLPNRALFMDRLSDSLARTADNGRRVALLFLDLDNFKVINDSLGHAIGDRLLVGVADRLRSCVRPCDTPARLGGDEFILLLEGLNDETDALDIARRVQVSLREPFLIDGHEVFATCSIGVTFADSAADPEVLLRNADIAMYQAKNGGKSRFAVFDSSMHDSVLQRLRLENDLRRALERGELAVYYQPELQLRSGTVVGMEALVRWHHPERGLLAPATFIPIAEETELIVPIGAWVLHEACEQARRWDEALGAQAPRWINVNLSARQFQHPSLVEHVTSALQSAGLDPSRLVLEITESFIVDDMGSTHDTLNQLAELGVRVAIDDFGTGYSSLAYLRRFAVHFLKIDQAFIRDLETDAFDRVIIGSIVNLAHAQGIQVVVEGVESARQLEVVRDVDADIAQGFHFAAPLPPDAALAFLRGTTGADVVIG